jgi:hypothetical protein
MVVDGQYRTLVTPGAPRAFSKFVALAGTGTPACPARCSTIKVEETTMGRGLLLWLLGVPIPVIILLWLFFGH